MLNILTIGEFTVDRKKFIEWAYDRFLIYAIHNLKTDLILGGEFILSAEDILEEIKIIPEELVNEKVPSGFTHVYYSLIKITYKEE